MKRLTEWPKPERGREAVLSVIADASREGRIGADLEFLETGVATIIGVATLNRCASWYWSQELGNAVLDADVPIAAFAGIGADKPIFEQNLDRKTPLSLWNDSMIKHFVCNPDLASVPKAAFTDEDDSDGNFSLGLMNIFSAMSMLHDVPQHKRCIGQEQCLREARPCRLHSELDYCAVDSWEGLVLDYSLDEQMAALKIPQSYYEFRKRVDHYCHKIKAKGVALNRAVIDSLDEVINNKKAALFPSTISYEGKPYKDGRKRVLKKPRTTWTGPFNPNSPKQVIAWFAEHGIELKDRGNPSGVKQVVLTALKAKFGLRLDGETGAIKLALGDEGSDDSVDDILFEPGTPGDVLLRLAQKQIASKGTASWVDPKYILNDELHPRFNSIGTCMGRLATSKPNINFPKNGIAADLRKSVVPHKGYKFLKADFKSLELFTCLWFARSSKSGEGVFEYLVNESEGGLEEAANLRAMSQRNVAKSVSHAASYGEGLLLLTAGELSEPTRIAERKAGALLVFDGHEHPEWTFRGKYVCFTGANLADRLFLNRRRESRKKALKLQEFYFGKLFELRDVFHRETLKECENTYEIRLPSGHRLPLYGRNDEDDVKQALACKGQGGGAVYAQEGMLRFDDRDDVMNLQQHDEYVFEVPIDWSDDQCCEFLLPAVQPSLLMPGFTCPTEPMVGPTWHEKTMRTLPILRYS